MYSYMNLERPREAQAAFEEARAQNLDGEQLRAARYALAFVQGDRDAMQEQLTWAMGKPGVEDLLLSNQSDTEAFYGRLGTAREFSQKAVESALRANSQETAAGWRVNEALREAELGNTARARQVGGEALAMSSGRDVLTTAAMTLARSGDLAQARRLADKLNKQFPLDTMMQGYALPAIRATIELKRNNSRRAIEILQTSKPYELGSASLPNNAFLPNLYPSYVMGQAYLQAGQGMQAAAESRKILNHPGLGGNFVIGALAHLYLGRAQVLVGDKAAARKSYQDFLTLWKDADPDIPIYKQAKAEYARLK
jgi:tetratricopeptide (TPR) repeat protein